MDITDFLRPERVLLDLRARDKPQLIGELASHFRRLIPTLSATAVETALLSREQLGSTGLGAGFALPHARVDGLNAYLGLFARLAKPIEFDAVDGKPIQFVFVLLIPSETATSHVAALAAISRRCRDANVLRRLATAKTTIEAYQILTDL